MQRNLAPAFNATPHGITIGGMPLNKSTSRKLPPETLRYVKRAQELLATVKKEDWDNRTPHATQDVPVLAKAQMMLALASPQTFDKQYNPVQRVPAKFDFVTEVSRGKTLLVGEGNLSFSLSLAKMRQITASNLTATTFESKDDWSSLTQANAKELQYSGVTVLSGVDATDLTATLGISRFDNIVFQFPHTGSRDEVEGHNSNFILVRDFLRSAMAQLTLVGRVIISAVDNPFYRGAFQFDEAANIAGFLPPEEHPFDPSMFPGYEHTMTHQDGSALENHDQFSTLVFRQEN